MAIIFNSRPGLVVYLTCGDPDLETTREVALAAIGAGADVIELGVPFSDPVADGPVIQRATERALLRRTSLHDVLEVGRQVRQKAPEAGLVLFSYYNPVLRYGLEKLCKDAARAGLDGALITDLPVEEAELYRRWMQASKLAAVFLAAPTSTDERLKAIAAASSGFVYAVSRTGVTGARAELPEDARDLVRRIRRYTRLPIAVGFGVSTAAQFAAVGEFADAAVVGSAIVQAIEHAGREGAAEAVAALVRELRGATAAPHPGAKVK